MADQGSQGNLQATMKPYLIRAIREWAMDNGFTPDVLVDATHPHVSVPESYVSDEGHIRLNIHDRAVQGLEISNDWILFNARFSGAVRQIDIPVQSVVGIFGRECGVGLMFAHPEREAADGQEAEPGDGQAPDAEMPKAAPKGKPHLRIVS